MRELADYLEVRPPVQRHVDVQAPAAGSPDEAGQAELAGQQVACPQRGPPDVREPLAVRRVEVEHQLVGRVQLVHPAGELVDLDAGLVGQVDQGGGLVADGVLNLAAFLAHPDAADPAGKVRGCVLLEEPLAVQAIGVAHHGDRPVPQPGQHPVGDIGVVAGQVGLGDPVSGKQHLVRMRERHRDAADRDLLGHRNLRKQVRRRVRRSRSPGSVRRVPRRGRPAGPGRPLTPCPRPDRPR